MGGNINFTSARAKLRIQRILKLLDVEAMTVEQLRIRLHAAKSGTHQYVRLLCEGNPKQIYIADYDTSGYRPIAIYTKGDAEDAPKPKKTKAQIWREIKADPVKLARVHKNQAETRDRRRGKPPSRVVRTYDPPLEQQVEELIGIWPGMTAPQIADKLDAGLKATKDTLTALRKSGRAVYKRRTREGALWESTARKVVTHAPVVAKQQGIFAALGL